MKGYVAAGLVALLGLWPGQPAFGQLAPRTAERDFAEAYSLFASQLYREAVQAFIDFREAYPDHVNTADALYYQAEAALSLGDAEEAVRLFTRFERLYPVHPLASQARLALGKFFFDARDYARALDIFGQILRENPSDELAAKTLYWMGESELQRERFEEAIGYYRRAADDYAATTTAPGALYAIGFTEVRRNRVEAAREAFELLASRYPESDYARNVGLALAEVYYELNEYEATVDEIERRMPSLGPEAQERASFLLAESLNQLRRTDEATEVYLRFVEGDPSSPYHRRALYGLAWNYYFAGEHAQAAEHFGRVRQGTTDELAERATYYQAVNEKLAEDPLRAIALFGEFLDRWPRSTLAEHARFELGVTHYQERQWQQAHDAFAEVARSHPESAHVGEALYYQGSAAAALGRFDAAEQDFDAALAHETTPEALHPEITFQRAWLQFETRRYQEAAAAFEAFHQEAPRTERGGEALFWAAESYWQLGRMKQAADLFQRYQRDYQRGRHAAAVHYALGWVYFRQKRYGDAATQFQQFLDQYRGTDDEVPYRTDAQLRLADSYYALRRYGDAVRTYDQVAQTASDYALYQVGQAHSNAGEMAPAVAAFRRLLSDYPRSDWAQESQYNLGYLYFENQQYDQAIAEYQQVIDRWPQDALAAKAQYGIGDALYNAGRIDEAVAAYREVLERYPDSPFVGDAAAGIQYALGADAPDTRAADTRTATFIREFTETNPGSPVVDELRFRQAEVRYQSGRVDEALAEFQQFVQASDNEALEAEAYYYLGLIYADRGQRQEAETYLRQIVDAYPESERFPQAARRLGDLFLEMNRAQPALAVFRRLEQIRSDEPRVVAEARAGQGLALAALGRTDEAERLLQEAIDAAPDDPDTAPAYLGLARVYARSGNPREAIRLYRLLSDGGRDEVGAEALYRLGLLLLDQGDTRAALDALSRLPALYADYTEWVAQGYLAQARAYARLGQPEEAARLYDQVMADFSGTPYAEAAQREKGAL